MLSTLILWSHALAAMLFAALALWGVRTGRIEPGLPRPLLSAALGLTALWALAVAGIGAGEDVTRLLDGLRNIGWLAVVAALHGRPRQRGAVPAMAHGVVALMMAAQLLLYLLSVAPLPDGTEGFAAGALALRAVAAVAALVLLNGVYPLLSSRPARVLASAMAAMWLIDFNLCTVHFILGTPPAEILVARGGAMTLVAGVIALALARVDDRPIQVSRTVAYQWLSVVGVAAFLAVMVAATMLIAQIGGPHARIVQTAFVFGSTAALLTLATTGWLRAWVRVKLAKHLFRHRYDYRSEWTRFTDTLGQPDDRAAPLDERVVKAIADLTDSPAGLLLVADGDVLATGAAWRWDVSAPAPAGDAALARYLLDTHRIVELDAVRAGHADPADAAAVPPWMLALEDGWALVPLPHLDRLSGAILLARPPIARALDWEDFDLLRIAGRQVASTLAEARARDALAEAQRFEEFNRRFAFILHDIKNLVSQLSLVARNAERHADNPEFRADMVATLNESAGRMRDLVGRLSQQGPQGAERPRATDLLALAHAIAARRRHQHPLVVEGEPAWTHADPQRLEQLVGHLVQNAVEASAPDAPVRLRCGMRGGHALLEVIDTGCGMSAAFVREQLFRPFVSSKPVGFGIGAFEALQIAQSLHGRLEVESRENAGSRFRLVLPALPVPIIEEAA